MLRKAAVLVAASLIMLGLSSPPALAWGDQDKCTAANKARATNDWNVFLFHKIRVYEVVCAHSPHDPLWLLWTSKPDISFPSRLPGNESLTVTNDPDVTKVWRWETNDAADGKAYAVRYSFTVRQCVSGTPLCSNLDFLFYVNTSLGGFTRICIDKTGDNTCDERKFWTWDE